MSDHDPPDPGSPHGGPPAAAAEPQFHCVEEAARLRPGRLKRVRAGGVAVCLANAGGRIVAFEDSCPHMKAPLSTGRIRDGLLQCAMHNWRFDLDSGRCVIEKWSWACLRLFPVRVEKGKIWVGIPPGP